VEFKILGPLEVWGEAGEVELGGQRLRALLARLLLSANQVVSTDALIDDLRDRESRRGAGSALRMSVARLRKALAAGQSDSAAELVQTRAPGYLIRLRPEQLDLRQFETLLSEGSDLLALGNAAGASERLRSATELWRGDPLGEFAYEDFATAAIARLNELRLVALERRVEADLATGASATLVAELEGLVREQPLRERLRAQLMLALYRAGRQAEALEAYQDARRTLTEELGIDPGTSLQQLHQRILQQDVELAGEPNPSVPSQPGTQRADSPLPTASRVVLIAALGERDLPDLVALGERLSSAPGRELMVAVAVVSAAELGAISAALNELRGSLEARGVATRTAAFTSEHPGKDLARLAVTQDVDLVLTGPGEELPRDSTDATILTLMREAPCDVGLLSCPTGTTFDLADGARIVVPFGGDPHDWTAVQIAAWIAADDGSLVLVGTQADPGSERRDASQLLANASFMVQRKLGTATDPLLVEPGAEGIASAATGAGLLVAGLSPRWREEGLGETRTSLLQTATVPTLLVRKGLRPGGVAPEHSLTRFTWSIAPD
jgi:DNA-binding SARP family transcriptional activator